ncbi:MAG: hypothetical protein LBR22_01285 [Desulfovibrio sp.]|nr:hypothetical protein [Desulfovibrio sp.]
MIGYGLETLKRVLKWLRFGNVGETCEGIARKFTLDCPCRKSGTVSVEVPPTDFVIHGRHVWLSRGVTKALAVEDCASAEQSPPPFTSVAPMEGEQGGGWMPFFVHRRWRNRWSEKERQDWAVFEVAEPREGGRRSGKLKVWEKDCRYCSSSRMPLVWLREETARELGIEDFAVTWNV